MSIGAHSTGNNHAQIHATPSRIADGGTFCLQRLPAGAERQGKPCFRWREFASNSAKQQDLDRQGGHPCCPIVDNDEHMLATYFLPTECTSTFLALNS